MVMGLVFDDITICKVSVGEETQDSSNVHIEENFFVNDEPKDKLNSNEVKWLDIINKDNHENNGASKGIDSCFDNEILMNQKEIRTNQSSAREIDIKDTEYENDGSDSHTREHFLNFEAGMLLSQDEFNVDGEINQSELVINNLKDQPNITLPSIQESNDNQNDLINIYTKNEAEEIDFEKNNEQVFHGEPDFVDGVTDSSAKERQPDEEVKFVLLSDLAARKKRGLGKLQCDQCDAKFHTKHYLSRHVKNVHIRIFNSCGTFVCQYCEQQFKTSSKKYTHEKFDCPKGERKTDDFVQCPLCNYKTRRINSGYLRRHIRFYHDKVYDHVCEVCGYKAIRADVLEKHVLSVHEGRKYPCDICGKELTSEDALRVHDRAYHKLEVITCKLCHYQTHTKPKMKQHHESKHLGIRYQCEECESKYTNEQNLQEHILIKHKGKKYPCKSCSSVSASRSALNQHMKTIHQKIRLDCPQCETTHRSKSFAFCIFSFFLSIYGKGF